MSQKISNLDLMNNKNTYNEEILLVNLNHLSIKTILHTQKLSAKFCAEHVYCVDNINDGDEDSYLFDVQHIMYCQPHLDYNKLIKYIMQEKTKN
jgi:hypothetical protein